VNQSCAQIRGSEGVLEVDVPSLQLRAAADLLSHQPLVHWVTRRAVRTLHDSQASAVVQSGQVRAQGLR